MLKFIIITYCCNEISDYSKKNINKFVSHIKCPLSSLNLPTLIKKYGKYFMIKKLLKKMKVVMIKTQKQTVPNVYEFFVVFPLFKYAVA